MKRIVFGLLAYSLSILTMAVFVSALHAQGNVDYRVHWLEQAIDWPPETTGITVKDLMVNDNANLALVVGSYTRHDRPGRQAFIYDHLGFMDPNQPQKFWDIQELVGPNAPSWAPPTHVRSRFMGVNRNGRLCGYIRSETGDYKGVFFDLKSEHQELQPLQETSTSATGFAGLRVNDLGDILILGETNGSWNQPEISIYNPDSNPPEKIDVPVSVNSVDDIYFNSSRQILGVIPGSVPWSGSTIFGSGVFRHTVMDTDNDGISDGVTEQFFDLTQPAGMNDFSQFSCILTFTIPKNRKQVRYEHHAARIGAVGVVEWETGSGTWDEVGDLNNAGDLLHLVEDGNLNTTPFMFYEGDPGIAGDVDEQPFFDFTNLIIGDELASGNETRYQYLSDRDHTDLGWILGTTDIDGDGVRETFLLVPESLDPTPGISVTPTSGLTTTEAVGDPATFTVVLDTQPTADVTIDVSSWDTTEGTINGSTNNSLTLTFTTTDWFIEQTVTVKGVDDLATDGDIDYEITATATGGDYEGLTAEVTVTNLDDDGPATYVKDYSLDPLPIPDNDVAGIPPSTLGNVPDHALFSSLTVNLNISHPRPSDLEVELHSPNDLVITLSALPGFTHVGDNDITGLISDTQGDWTLVVRDLRKKKKGFLNYWSITVVD